MAVRSPSKFKHLFRRCCLMTSLWLIPFTLSANSLSTGAFSEWEEAKTILMHTPGEEIFLGVAYPEPALFDVTFDMDKAAAEHRAYIESLKAQGISVLTVTDVLTNSNRRDLIDLARKASTVRYSRLNAADKEEEQRCFESNLSSLPTSTLVRIVTQRPTFRLSYAVKPSARNHQLPECKKYYIKADYGTNPVMNLYFTRDQMITTAKGVVLGKMKLPQRGVETDIMAFVLRQLGITPIYQVRGKNATLEGGDFLPAGERVFIGQGIRTSEVAIKQLLDNDVFGGADHGVKEVVVVKDHWNNQQEMHLDTHFNLINEKLAVSVADRVNCTADLKKCLTADVYQWRGGWQLVYREIDFNAYLSDVAQIKVIPVSVDDQAKYGINFLTTSRNQITGVDGVSQTYKDALQREGVSARWLDFTNLKLGFGAAHCTTQVLMRQALQ